MILTSAQVEDLLENRLKKAGLFKFVDWGKSQFLNLEEELFVEYVLTDGDKLHEVEKIVRHTAEEMKKKDIQLNSVVRALWEVVDLHYVGPSRSLEGGPRAASELRGTLKSGTRECQVTVDVTAAAADVLRQRRGGDDISGAIAEEVRHFLTRKLSYGGTSYWDPLLDSRLNLSAADMSFLLGYGAAFEELRQAIEDALEPPVLNSFLADLSRSGTRIRDFDAVLPNFSNLLGGAYRPGQTFSISASELFSKLLRTEQEFLRQYFRAKVAELEQGSPKLKQEFPVVFS